MNDNQILKTTELTVIAPKAVIFMRSLKYLIFIWRVEMSGAPVDGESDRTVESDTNINCTRFLFNSLNTYVNTFVLLVFYIVVACLYFFSILKFNKNISDTIYFGVRLHCPVRFTVHGCNPFVLL